MFRSCTFLSFFIVFTICAGWITYLAYKPLHLQSPSSIHAVCIPSIGEQTRRQVRKDIWLADPVAGRLHNRIESDSSLLTLTPKSAHSLEVVERLSGIRCWIQEKVQVTGDKPFQQMRFFIAKEGVYNYKHQNLEATQAILSLYKTVGLQIPWDLKGYQPFLQGSAEKILFSFHNEMPIFQATNFKASSKRAAP